MTDSLTAQNYRYRAFAEIATFLRGIADQAEAEPPILTVKGRAVVDRQEPIITMAGLRMLADAIEAMK
jgi:hypothetical protein